MFGLIMGLILDLELNHMYYVKIKLKSSSSINLLCVVVNWTTTIWFIYRIFNTNFYYMNYGGETSIWLKNNTNFYNFFHDTFKPHKLREIDTRLLRASPTRGALWDSKCKKLFLKRNSPLESIYMACELLHQKFRFLI